VVKSLAANLVVRLDEIACKNLAVYKIGLGISITCDCFCFFLDMFKNFAQVTIYVNQVVK
jgi:hypothetical protein